MGVLNINKKSSIIILVVVSLILLGFGGYLLWRVNQKDTVAPTDSDAGVCFDDRVPYCNISDCLAAVNKGTGSPATTTTCTNGYWIKSGVGCQECPSSSSSTTTKYTLKYTAGSNGKLTGTLTQTVVKGKDGSAVTAVPNEGYVFKSWSDGVTSNPRTDKSVTKNITVTANFEIGKYTLEYKADSGGTLIGTVLQTVNHGASGTAVKAIPSSGYYFVKWNDSVTTAERTDSNVVKSISVTAIFSKQCGNGICDSGENASSCPADCSGGSVPQTGLFDDSKSIIAIGGVLLVLGVSWGSIQNISLSFLGGLRRYLSNIAVRREEEIIEKRRSRVEDPFKDN